MEEIKNIIRVEKTRNYSIISNIFLREPEMSMKAKGLLAYMLSLPDNWDFSVQGLCSAFPDGRKAITTAIRELEEFGYMVKNDQNRHKGKFARGIYTVYEEPVKTREKGECGARTSTFVTADDDPYVPPLGDEKGDEIEKIVNPEAICRREEKSHKKAADMPSESNEKDTASEVETEVETDNSADIIAEIKNTLRGRNVPKVQTDFPSTDFPSTDLPLAPGALAQKGTQLNTNKQKTKYIYKPQAASSKDDNLPETKTGLGKENTKSSYFGVLKNVFLSGAEYESLKGMFPNDYAERIDELSTYMASRKKDYEDHYATIINWSLKKKKESKSGKGRSSGSSRTSGNAAAEWDKIITAVSKYGRTEYLKAKGSFGDSITKEAVDAIGWMNICNSQNPYESRKHFINTYNTIAKRRATESPAIS